MAALVRIHFLSEKLSVLITNLYYKENYKQTKTLIVVKNNVTDASHPCNNQFLTRCTVQMSVP